MSKRILLGVVGMAALATAGIAVFNQGSGASPTSSTTVTVLTSSPCSRPATYVDPPVPCVL